MITKKKKLVIVTAGRMEMHMLSLTKMKMLKRLRGGLIVSCQASEREPMYGWDTMVLMAAAAKEGGACGIRANGGHDIRSIVDRVGLPVIGLVKQAYAGSDIYITPTYMEIVEAAEAGAHIIALDATFRERPDGARLDKLIMAAHAKYPERLFMADVSTYEEAINAQSLGFDVVSTTLSGYTHYSPQEEKPNFNLVERLAADLKIPVFAEGRIKTPEQAAKLISLGAWSVVVGGAITRPQLITKEYVEKIGQVYST